MCPLQDITKKDSFLISRIDDYLSGYEWFSAFGIEEWQVALLGEDTEKTSFSSVDGLYYFDGSFWIM